MRPLFPIFFVLACKAAGPGDLCSELADAPSCGGETKQMCDDALEVAEAEPCAQHVAALADCIAGLELSCTSATSISAVGDGMVGGGQNFTDIAGFSVVVNDSACDVHRRGLEACRTCADAAGAQDVGVLGVGDRCATGLEVDGVTAECAAGLVCDGVCSRACQSDSDCNARADACALQYQYPNVCVASQCRRSCGDDYSCQAWVGDASACAEQACTLP